MHSLLISNILPHFMVNKCCLYGEFDGSRFNCCSVGNLYECSKWSVMPKKKKEKSLSCTWVLSVWWYDHSRYYLNDFSTSCYLVSDILFISHLTWFFLKKIVKYFTERCLPGDVWVFVVWCHYFIYPFIIVLTISPILRFYYHSVITLKNITKMIYLYSFIFNFILDKWLCPS